MTHGEFADLLKESAVLLADDPPAASVCKEIAALDGGAKPAQLLQAATRCTRALLEIDKLDAAGRVYSAMTEVFATQPPGWVGLARVATQRGAWAEAVALWRDCFARFPDREMPDWVMLSNSAVAGLRDGSPPPPPLRRPQPPMIRPAAKPSEPERPAPAVMYGPRTDGGGTPMGTIHALLRGDRLPEARTVFPQALAAATDVTQLRAVYMIIGPLFDGWERTNALLNLRAALDQRAASFNAERARDAAFLRLRICLSLRDYVTFRRDYETLTQAGPVPAEDAALVRIAAKLTARPFPNFAAEKVFGIGLSKTGTTSFVAALEMLGYSALHWTNPATHELFCDDDVFLFDAFADLPTCEHFEQYYFAFPNARFIYTTRPFESWKRSYLAQMQARGDQSFGARRNKAMRADGVPWGARNARLSFSMYYNYSSIEEAFETYDRRVRSFFADKPADRFLEFSLSDGHAWPELCGFLNRPVPNQPYPRKNPQRATGAA
jgi:hypothetical protein